MNEAFAIKIPENSIPDKDRFLKALEQFDTINKGDPKTLSLNNTDYPAEYLLAQALFKYVIELDPTASEALLLASRSQHLKRWEKPRNSYPEGRQGYLDWRASLKLFHADEAAKILSALGYNDETLAAVRTLNLKEDIKGNPACQTLEDGLCLVFLEFQYDDIISKYPEAKVISILKKTSSKMSPKGLEAAGRLNYSEKAKALLQKALS